MELLFRGIARAGGIEVPPEVRIFEPPKRKPRESRLSVKLREATRGLAGWLKRLAERLATHAGSAGGRPIAP